MSKEGQRDTAALWDRVVWDVLPTARLPGWRIYTHICVRTQKHCHLSLWVHPWSLFEPCVWAGTPLSWLWSNMEVSHLAGWAGGPASFCELFLDLGCIAPVFFCFLLSNLVIPCFFPPLYKTLWLMRMSFNFQDHLLSIMQCRLSKHDFYMKKNGYKCLVSLNYCIIHIMDKTDKTMKISLHIIVIIVSFTIYCF